MPQLVACDRRRAAWLLHSDAARVDPPAAARGAVDGPGLGGGLTDLRRYSPHVLYLAHLTSALYLDNPKDVNSYLRAMQRLNTQALTSFETTQFLRQLLKQPLLA